MTELPMTWRHICSVWWSFTWRNLVWVGVPLLAVSIPLGLFMGASNLSPRAALWISNGVGLVLWVPLSILAVQSVLDNPTRRFRIALVAVEDNAANQSVPRDVPAAGTQDRE